MTTPPPQLTTWTTTKKTHLPRSKSPYLLSLPHPNPLLFLLSSRWHSRGKLFIFNIEPRIHKGLIAW
nr:hypothetical protein CFP56_33878 [Quercus suber]